MSPPTTKHIYVFILRFRYFCPILTTLGFLDRFSWKSPIPMLIKIQPDATVCRYLFTAKSLYMFRVLQHPSSGVLKTVTAAPGTATSLQRGLIRPRWREVAVPVL